MAQAAPPFEARYSILKLVGWALLAAPLALASAWLVLQAGVLPALLGTIGLLFFGGAIAGCVRCMIDRRVQLRIDGEGLLIRAHANRPIALRSIDRISTDFGRINIRLYKPSKYPISRVWRRTIYRINGTAARDFFGDAWIWTAHYNCTRDQVLDAIAAYRPLTAFERDLAERLRQSEP